MSANFDVSTLSASGPRIVVSDLAEFQAAAAQLSGSQGGTIALASNFQSTQIQLNGVEAPGGQILIVPDDPQAGATIEGIRLINCENITVAGLDFDSSTTTRASWLKDVMVDNSNDISFLGNSMVGAADSALFSASAAVGDGIQIRSSADIEFSHNYVAGYTHGLTMLDVQDTVVQGNEFTQMQGDAFHGGGWQNMLIEDNWFHDMFGSSQQVSHSDMIQLWTVNTKTQTDGVIIRGNILDSGSGPAYQSIFVTNDGLTKPFWHKNVLIEDNVIHNAMANGIRFSGVIDGVVQNNTVLWNPASAEMKTATSSVSSPPQINVYGDNLIVQGNIAPKIVSATPGVDLSNNVVLDYTSPSSSNYVNNHIVHNVLGGDVDIYDLQLLPTSSWVGQYGAPLSQPTSTAPDLAAVMREIPVTSDRGLLTFDASLSRDDTGYLDESEATFIWTFPDGSQKTGITVTHDFGDDASGGQGVTLTVIRNDGTTDTIDRTAYLIGRESADIDFEGTADTWDDVQLASVDPNDLTAGFSGQGYRLDGQSSLKLDNGPEFHDLDKFTMGFFLKKDMADGSGRVLDLQNAMQMDITGNGTVNFRLITDQGSFVVNSGALKLDDTAWHKVNVVYDGPGGALRMFVDGEEANVVAASGTTGPQYSWGMQLGSPGPWRPGVEAVIDNFEMDAVATSVQEIADDYAVDIGSNPTPVQPLPAPPPPAPVAPAPAPAPVDPAPAPAPSQPTVSDGNPAPAPGPAAPVLTEDFVLDLVDTYGSVSNAIAAGATPSGLTTVDPGDAPPVGITEVFEHPAISYLVALQGGQSVNARFAEAMAQDPDWGGSDTDLWL